MYCKAGIFSHILWNAKHLCNFVEDNYIIWFDYMEFLILINPFTTNPGYGQICVNPILTRWASPPDRDGIKTDLMLANMKNDIFPLISTIVLPRLYTWNVGSDLLKLVCGIKISKRKK